MPSEFKAVVDNVTALSQFSINVKNVSRWRVPATLVATQFCSTLSSFVHLLASSLITSYILRNSPLESLSFILSPLNTCSTSLRGSPKSSVILPAATLVRREKIVLKLLPTTLALRLEASETAPTMPRSCSNPTPLTRAMLAVLWRATASSSTEVAAAKSTADIASTTCIASFASFLYPLSVEVRSSVACEDSIAPTFDRIIEDSRSWFVSATLLPCLHYITQINR